MVFELEGLATLGTFELAEVGALVVADHVTLQTVHVREHLVAHTTHLENKVKVSLLIKCTEYLFFCFGFIMTDNWFLQFV